MQCVILESPAPQLAHHLRFLLPCSVHVIPTAHLILSEEEELGGSENECRHCC